MLEVGPDVSPFLLRRASDEKLGGRLAAGEAAAFDELYHRYARRLAAYGSRLTGDRSSGEDVAQTALLKAYSAIVDGRAPTHLRPWLFRIAHNAALDLVARRREVPTPSVTERAAPAHEPLAGVLVTAVAALPERQRHVFVLRELHGLRIDETALELGLSAPQVEQALFAARNRLSEQLTFGGRLDCILVRRLGRESLDVRERQALKAHLRTCAACRAEAGRHERASAAVSLAPLLWLRGLVASLAGSSAAALKAGAVVATLGVAAGVPALRMEIREARIAPAEAVAVPHDQGFQDVAVVVAAASRSSYEASPPRAVPASTHVARMARRSVPRDQRSGPDRGPSHGSASSSGHDDSAAQIDSPVKIDDHSGPGGGGGADPVQPAPAPAPVAAAPTTQEPVEDHSGGGGDSSGPGSGVSLTVESQGDGSHSGSGRDGSGGADGSDSSGGDDHALDDLTDSH